MVTVDTFAKYQKHKITLRLMGMLKDNIFSKKEYLLKKSHLFSKTLKPTVLWIHTFSVHSLMGHVNGEFYIVSKIFFLMLP